MVGDCEISKLCKSRIQRGEVGVRCDVGTTGNVHLVSCDPSTAVQDVATGCLEVDSVGCCNGSACQVDRARVRTGRQLDIAACVGDFQLGGHVSQDSTRAVTSGVGGDFVTGGDRGAF